MDNNSDVLKNQAFKLARSKLPIPLNDPSWETFWNHEIPFLQLSTALSPHDIRFIRDESSANFVNWLNSLILNIIKIGSQESNSNWNTKHLINSVRLLTLLMPFLYESSSLTRAFETAVWHSNLSTDQLSLPSLSKLPSADKSATNGSDSHMIHNDKPVAANLLITLCNLLFTLNFTIIDQNNSANSSLSNTTQLILWEPGIGKSKIYSSPDFQCDMNRLDILKLLISLCSINLYDSFNNSIKAGSKFLSYLVSSVDKQLLTFLFASLLNLICRSTKLNDSINSNLNGLNFDNQYQNRLKLLLVSNSIQLFSVMLVYSIPNEHLKILNLKSNVNLTRVFCSKISKPNELDLIINNLFNPLFNPILNENNLNNFILSNLNSNFDYLPNWSNELLIIFIEFYQCNSNFRLMLPSSLNSRLFVMLTYYIIKFQNTDKYFNFVSLCSIFLLILSNDLKNFSSVLLNFNTHENYYNSLPQWFKINTLISFRDFILIKLSNLIVSNYVDLNSCHSKILIYLIFNLISFHSFTNNTILSMRRLSIKDNSIKGPPTQLSFSASNSIVNLVSHLLTKLITLANNNNNNNLNLNSVDQIVNYISLILKSCCHSIAFSSLDSIILIYLFAKNNSLFERLKINVAKLSDLILEHNVNLEKLHINTNIGNNNSNLSLNSPLSIPPLSRQQSATNLSEIDDLFLEKEINNYSIADDRSSVNSTSTSNVINSPNSDSFVLPIDISNFLKPYMPIGMSDYSQGKKLKYDKLETQWDGKNALMIILKLNRLVIEQFKLNNDPSRNANSNSILIEMNKFDLNDLISGLPIEDEYFKLIKFHWSVDLLGWYESILWNCIFLNYQIVNLNKNNILTDLGSSFKKVAKASSNESSPSIWGSFKKLFNESNENDNFINNIPINSIWLGTNIKLFKINSNLLKEHYKYLNDRYSNLKSPSPIEGFLRRQNFQRKNSFELNSKRFSNNNNHNGKEAVDNGALRYNLSR